MNFIFSEQQFNFENIDHNLAHLSRKQIVDMINHYYASVTATALVEHYNLEVMPSKVVKLFPLINCAEVCPYCNLNLLIRLPAKSRIYDECMVGRCPNCDHENMTDCTCPNCRAVNKIMKRKREIEKCSIIESYYDLSKGDLISELEISIKDRIYLSALLRARIDEGLKIIHPVSEYNSYLTPTKDFDYELLNDLFIDRVIVPHPISKTTAFMENENFPEDIFPLDIIFRLNIKPFDDDYKRMVSDLMYPNSRIIRSSISSCMEVWGKLAYAEVVNYFSFKLKSLSLPVRIGDKTRAVFEHLLEDFTVSQIYNITYHCIAGAFTYGKEKHLSYPHIANLVCARMENYGERVKANNWDLTKYRRPRELPDSMISNVFFQSLLLTRENGIDIQILEHHIKPSDNDALSDEDNSKTETSNSDNTSFSSNQNS